MAEVKTCPKCGGSMAPGRIMRKNEFAGDQYMYVYAPDDDSGPSLGQVFGGKAQSSPRRGLAAYACQKCGYTEFYTVPAG